MLEVQVFKTIPTVSKSLRKTKIRNGGLIQTYFTRIFKWFCSTVETPDTFSMSNMGGTSIYLRLGVLVFYINSNSVFWAFYSQIMFLLLEKSGDLCVPCSIYSEIRLKFHCLYIIACFFIKLNWALYISDVVKNNFTSSFPQYTIDMLLEHILHTRNQEIIII